MRFARAGFDGGVMHFRYARRNADDHARFGHDREALVHFADEVMEHQLRYVEIADDAVFERPDCHNVGRRAPNHALGVGAYGERTLRLGVDRHYRWFVDDDAFAPHQYQGVGRTQVDTDVTGKHPHDAVERIAQRHVVY